MVRPLAPLSLLLSEKHSESNFISILPTDFLFDEQHRHLQLSKAKACSQSKEQSLFQFTLNQFCLQPKLSDAPLSPWALIASLQLQLLSLPPGPVLFPL